MPYVLNLLYLVLALFLSPWIAFKICTAVKWRRNLWTKLYGRVPRRTGDRPCVWFHGVSMGEIHLLRQVVARFREVRPDCEVVISSSTIAGLEEARKHFADLTVFCWPLDFTWAVKRALRNVQPALVVLAESEIWPNFLLLARKFGAKIAIINGRMSPRSFRRHRRAALITGNLLRRVDCWAMQTEEYAAGVRGLGLPAAAVTVTGSVKYDGVNPDRDNPRTVSFRQLFGVERGDLVWVAGSTQSPEEEIVLDVFQNLRRHIPNLRLILVPRQKDQFDAVADLLQRRAIPCVRRSRLTQPVTDRNAVILVDTIGELAAVWGLADLAFVGGSLDGQRGGQNMIEPAAYGAAVVFGPHTWNFKETVTRLLEQEAAIQVQDARELEHQLLRLAQYAELRRQLGQAARQFVHSQQGATATTVALLCNLLPTTNETMVAA
jgi:3-deoxy-D-manno-octulosonic-acid transferase